MRGEPETTRLDLITQAMLFFFAALFAGGLLGALVGRLTRFEIGLGCGLLVPGIVAGWFAWRCLAEFEHFVRAGENAVAGEVIAVEDRPVNAAATITQPVPVIRFAAPDGSVHTMHGPAASSMRAGETVDVIYDPTDPQRSRVGQRSELRGGAIAMMLFGTFPLSVGIWFLYSGSFGAREKRRAAANAANREVSALRERLLRDSAYALHFAMFGAILWVGLGPGALERRFALGFGGVALVLAGYALRSLVDPRATPSTVLAFVVLAVNFGVWAFALRLLM